MGAKGFDDPCDKASKPETFPPTKPTTNIPPEPELQPEPTSEPFAPYNTVGPRGGHGDPR